MTPIEFIEFLNLNHDKLNSDIIQILNNASTNPSKKIKLIKSAFRKLRPLDPWQDEQYSLCEKLSKQKKPEITQREQPQSVTTGPKLATKSSHQSSKSIDLKRVFKLISDIQAANQESNP